MSKCLCSVLGLLCIALFGVNVGVSSEQNFSVEILDYGVISIHKKNWSGVARGSATQVDAVEFAETRHTAHKIPLEMGMNFGIKFILNAPTAGQEVRLTIKGTHPKMQSPTRAKTEFSYEYQAIVITNELSYVGYEISEAREMLEGPWEIQGWHGAKMLFTKTFELYAPSGSLTHE